MGVSLEKGIVFAQPSLEKLHPATDENKYRHCAENCQSLNGMSPSKLSSQGSGNPSEEEGMEAKSQKEWRTQDPLHLYDQHSDELTEAEAACTRPAWLCTRSSVCVLWLLV